MSAAGRARPNALLSLIAWLLPASRAKNWVLRKLGNDIAASAVINPNLVMRCGRFAVGSDTIVDPFNVFRNLSSIELGERVRIGRYNQVSAAPEYQKYSDQVGTFVMRDVSLLTNRHYLDCSGQVIIGYHAAVGGMRTIMQSHEFDLDATHATVGRITIGEFAMTASCCLLLKDAYVPPYSVLAAGTVVAKRRDDTDLKPGLYGGVPARFIRDLPELGWWENDDVVRPVKPFDDETFRRHGS